MVQVRVEVETRALALPVDQAIPMGLILSELTSNAAKYAFTTDKPGRFFVYLDYKAELVQMKVQDDGPGIDLPAARAKGRLGLVLIEALAMQIKGSIVLEPAPVNPVSSGIPAKDNPCGSIWILCFPCNNCRISG
jgi:two-component sensor histidine kinase